MSHELNRIKELYEFYSNSNNNKPQQRRLLTEAYNLTLSLNNKEKTHPIVHLIEDLYNNL